MSNDNKFDFPLDESAPQDDLFSLDIGDEIGADVEAIMSAGLTDPSEQIGADVEAIMSESASDPGADIGAEVEAILSEAASEEAAEVPETVSSNFFDIPTPEIPAESEPVMADSTCVIPVSEDSDAVTADDAIPAETVSSPEEDVTIYESAAVFDTIAEEVPQPQESVPADATQVLGSTDELYHSLLDDPVVGAEIGADEHAIYAAGLVHPSDAELDRIIADAADAAGDTPNLENLDPSGESGKPLEGIFPQDPNGEDIVFQDYEDPNQPTDEPPVVEGEDAEEDEPDLPKRRPRMKKGYGLLGIPHILATVVWLVITVVIGISLGRMIWVCAAEVLAFGKPDQEYTITVTDADNIETIASKLKNAGLIKYPELFKLYAGITDAEEELSPGTFTLNSKYDYNALVKAMTYHSTAREEVEVMIPEGYTCAQIFALLEERGVCTAAELEAYAANGELDDYWFLEGVTRGDKYALEGYLFPDTYKFYTNDDPGRVIAKFLNNFDNRFTDIMKEKIDPLNERMAAILSSRGYSQDYIDAHKFTIREIVIIASMIEKETANDSESYDVSSVIYNRLTNPAEYLYLNIDATIIYALGGNIDPVTGKTKPLTSEDLKLNSPYNTYTEPGLIPGPISNPGRNSLNAALDPNNTKYYYYVFNPNTGKHMFAQTKAEHDRNVEYVRSLENNNG